MNKIDKKSYELYEMECPSKIKFILVVYYYIIRNIRNQYFIILYPPNGNMEYVDQDVHHFMTGIFFI